MFSKTFSAFLLLSLVITGKDSDIVVWSKDYKLKWSEYKAEPFIHESDAAISAIGLMWKPVSQDYDHGLFNVYAYFDKKESCIYPEKVNEIILNHEQRHFDIGEICARKLRCECLRLTNKITIEDCSQNLEKLRFAFLDSMDVINEKYDRETHNSRNLQKQNEWDKIIADELKGLDKYKSQYLYIYFKK
jgi:hypothetical protein